MRRGEIVNVDLFCLFHFIILYSVQYKRHEQT